MKEVDWLLTVFLVLSWHTASASTNARVYQISTKMNGNYRTNGASMAGGTLLYIQGQGQFIIIFLVQFFFFEISFWTLFCQ